MYNLYGVHKFSYILALVVFGGGLPFVIYALIADYLSKGFSETTIIGSLCVLLIILALIFFIYLLVNEPYRKLRQLKKTNPELLEKIESEFNEADVLCKSIWKSGSFYYFAGRRTFIVVPIGHVEGLEVRTGFTKTLGVYHYFLVRYEGDETEVVVSVLYENKNNALEIAEMIASESGIKVVTKN